ncbi:3-deoxy-manno-octulosonate cytidylyltransferase (CMP-KDO synthetase) [Desulfobaculum xiamenense]|uniref:3-deoxy-manno-octulosonate cytidylyltransferase n=1 Tax=Desulfobaculum xiamenense TaxID=995050 RepID=A0A846QNT2_9BACT|nr:3-deoxy-manno-octulosonate cytidylyltransferase [Desulfobaculum xiamenense]NJB67065.1 3-deoxy-manno-octulosonate cytidylyltransferase (CMP-KDO synthetase) [Desulfobaculum xiamenense]
MPKLPPCYGIIPARYGSSRFEGKPLADILGRPMFWHVYQRAIQCPLFGKVVVATDDNRIYSAACKYNIPVVMTSANHASGTDRVLEAAEMLSLPEDAVVANIQGDEPLLAPAMLTELLEPFADPDIRVTTLATRISAEEAQSPDQVKVVWTRSGSALYFSRAPIPFVRDGGEGTYWGHIGLYAFRMSTLRRFVALGQSELEGLEKLEQLRLLENDIPIYVVPTQHRTHGVDRPEDIDKVIKALSENS